VKPWLDHDALASANLNQSPYVVVLSVFDVFETLTCLRDVVGRRQMSLGHEPAECQLNVMPGSTHRCGRSAAIDLYLEGLLDSDLVAAPVECAIPLLDSTALGGGHLLMVLRVVGLRFHYDGEFSERR
jgi:hypothetical protein